MNEPQCMTDRSIFRHAVWKWLRCMASLSNLWNVLLNNRMLTLIEADQASTQMKQWCTSPWTYHLCSYLTKAMLSKSILFPFFKTYILRAISVWHSINSPIRPHYPAKKRVFINNKEADRSVIQAHGEQIWQGYTKRLLADLLASRKVGQSREEKRGMFKIKTCFFVLAIAQLTQYRI